MNEENWIEWLKFIEWLDLQSWLGWIFYLGCLIAAMILGYWLLTVHVCCNIVIHRSRLRYSFKVYPFDILPHF